MNQCGFEIFPYCIDWVATGAMLGGVAALITSVAVLVSAILGFLTYKTWKTRESFSSKRDLAINVLVHFHEGKQIIQSIRSKNILSDERETVIRALLGFKGKFANKSAIREFSESQNTDPEIIEHRINSYSKYWDRLNSLLLNTKAVFGDEVWQYLLAVLVEKQELEIKCRSFHEVTKKEQDEYQKVLFRNIGLASHHDGIMDRLNTAEKKLNELLQPFIAQSDESYS